MERRLPEHRHRHRQPAELPRHRGVQRRHGHDSGLRADVGELQGAVRDRRLAHSSRSDRSRFGWRHNGAARRRGHGPLAEHGLHDAVARRLSAHARAVLQGRELARQRRRRLHRHVPSVERKRGHQSRSHGHVRERSRRAQRVSVPVALRLAPVESARLRHLGRRLRVLRRPRAVRVLDQAVRPEGAGDAPVRFDAHRRRSRALYRFPAAARSAVRRLGVDAQPSRVATATFSSTRRRA